MKRRVVITGMGIISPLGIGVEESWASACQAKSGIGPITRFDTTEYPAKIAGEVKNFNPEPYVDKKDVKKMDIFIQYALAAGTMAIKQSGLVIDESNADRVGVLVGSGLGGLQTIEKYHSMLLESGPKKISPFFVPMLIVNLAPGQISIYFGCRGPNSSVVTACATGNHSIGEAFRIIQRGDADAMIAGGVEATITPLAVAGFCALKALSTRNDEPQKASRPFEKDRDGFVMAEGAGILVLEDLDQAKKRGAQIFAEIIGFGCNADAYHITAPPPNGEGAARCMQIALDDAGIRPEDIDYINAHGTSTPLNDLSETIAMKSVFKEHAQKNLLVSSTKSMTGHLLGAAGGVEAIFTVLTIKDGIIPPTINYDTPDPECDLDYVPNVSRKRDVRIAMSNSFGFGGTNATLIFKRYEE